MAGFSVLLRIFIVLLATIFVEGKYMVYNTSAGVVPRKINVHLVPHTHDDVGWLKTVDEYYIGANETIQIASVHNILDSLIPTLVANKDRKFVYVEMAFFKRWWNDQSDESKNTVRMLVNSGQLEFINAGMVMHDEATTHYIDMIDQTTLGHKFLKQEFNFTPRIGWQIDPFGHSAVQAYLLGAEVGFDALFFARIDYQDREKRLDDKTLEVIWEASTSRGSSSQIFADAFWKGDYEPPTTFYFDPMRDGIPVQDDPDLFNYNVMQRVDDFVAAALAQANVTRSNHVMWTMGTDFMYGFALSWFRDMDKLIHYVNLDGRVNALYSTPSLYADWKYAASETWPLKTGDFFPYADYADAYWTGYFTSRPALKGYVRLLSSYYLAARQLEYFVGRNNSGPTTDSLADAMAIAQHHDAVTGTSQQHVADDYAERLSIGYTESTEVVAASLDHLTKIPGSKFEQCALLNISHCPATEVDLSTGKKVAVLVYNSLGWKRTDVVKIPVINENVKVEDSSGNVIPAQVIPVADPFTQRNPYFAISRSSTLVYSLSFAVTVPPLGFNTYYITSTDKSEGPSNVEMTTYNFDGSQEEDIVIGSGNLQLVYSGKDGKLVRYINNKSKVNVTLEQSYSYYAGFAGTDCDKQTSGAYIFRPNGSCSIQPAEKMPLLVYRGPLFDEVHHMSSYWVYQITRVYRDKEHAVHEFSVGPISVDDNVGKEVVTKLKTDIASNRTFYTDSNGRDFLQRIKNYRADWNLEVNEPIAGNYYPINLGIYIKDEKTEFSLLVDRAVGGSSINDGEVEIMLHRRLLYDDQRGVGEPLNEVVCYHDLCHGLIVVGKYFTRLDRVGEGSKWRRTSGQEIYSPLHLAFTTLDKSEKLPVPTFSGMDSSYSLPENVALITLQELEDGSVLLRLAHLYEVAEDKDLSTVASVELKKVFPTQQIKYIKEMSLSANQERAEMEKKRLLWKAEGSNSKPGSRGGPVDPGTLLVELAPMEIRTFIIDFE